MFYKIGVLENFTDFTGKHLCRSLFLRIPFFYRTFMVATSVVTTFTTSSMKNTSCLLLLQILTSDKHKKKFVEKVLINKHIKKTLLNEPIKSAETFYISSAVQFLFAIVSNGIRRKFVGILLGSSDIGNYCKITDQPKCLIFRHYCSPTLNQVVRGLMVSKEDDVFPIPIQYQFQ